MFKSINAVTPCIFVIPDSLKFEDLEWESELSNRSLLELSHRLGVYLSWGGRVVSQVVHLLGEGYLTYGGDKPSLVNPNSCRLPAGGMWYWRLHDARER